MVISLQPAQPVAFPLYLRIPRWCTGVHVALNGKALELGEPAAYLRLERTWSPGDRLELELQMALGLTRWPRNGSVTVDRGPLSYSLRIGEQWQRVGGSDAWPEWEVLPTSPWNYGLELEDAPLQVIEHGVRDAQPWTPEAAPIEISARGRRITGWQLENETAGELLPSPIRSDEPLETLTLIPLGCARLRIACFPVIGRGSDARPWMSESP